MILFQRLNSFTILFSDLAALPQIWPPCHRFDRPFTDLAAVPQIGPLCHRFDGCATDLAAEPQILLQIWQPCHRFGHHATDLAIMPQIWPPCHRFGKDLKAMQRMWLVPQIWQRDAKRYGDDGKYDCFVNILFLCCKLSECFKSKGINHASGV